MKRRQERSLKISAVRGKLNAVRPYRRKPGGGSGLWESASTRKDLLPYPLASLPGSESQRRGKRLTTLIYKDSEEELCLGQFWTSELGRQDPDNHLRK